MYVCVCKAFNEHTIREFAIDPQYQDKSYEEIYMMITGLDGFQCGQCEDMGDALIDHARREENVPV